MSIEKRKSKRKAVEIVVDHQQSSLLQQFHARNLSTGGIFLVTHHQAPDVGEILELRFQIPGFPGRIEASAEILYHHKFEERDPISGKTQIINGMGLKFVNLSSENQQLIAEFVEGKHVHVRK